MFPPFGVTGNPLPLAEAIATLPAEIAFARALTVSERSPAFARAKRVADLPFENVSTVLFAMPAGSGAVSQRVVALEAASAPTVTMNLPVWRAMRRLVLAVPVSL